MADNQTLQILATVAGVLDDRAIPRPPGDFRPAAAVAAPFIVVDCAGHLTLPTAPHQSSYNRGTGLFAPNRTPRSASIISHIVAQHGGVAPSL